MKKAIAIPLIVLSAILIFTLYNGFIMDQNTVHWCGQLQQAGGKLCRLVSAPNIPSHRFHT